MAENIDSNSAATGKANKAGSDVTVILHPSGRRIAMRERNNPRTDRAPLLNERRSDVEGRVVPNRVSR